MPYGESNQQRVTCIPIRCHTKRQTLQSFHSKQYQPWRRKCLTCCHPRNQLTLHHPQCSQECPSYHPPIPP
nr:hypothetical protein Iba_scaffold10654CG0010 [Ipomoea batatas]